ncbi:hypothetical protein A2U01_0018890, partial [Trifolium medium]|nr:hypothetical protein [Trifolium medium]
MIQINQFFTLRRTKAARDGGERDSVGAALNTVGGKRDGDGLDRAGKGMGRFYL